MGRTFGVLAAGVTGGIVLRNAVSTLAQFSQAMSTVQAVAGATATEFERLRNESQRLGATTRFTATQAAEGALFLARAGFDANEILGSLQGTLQLAQAGALELGSAADIASNVLQGFRLEVEETGRVVDVLALAANSSNTNVQQLGDALKLVAPIAAGLGVDIEETTAAVGALSNAGLQATLAGTGLRRVLSELASPNTGSQRILEDLGLRTRDYAVQTIGLTQALVNLSDAGITTSQALEVFGQRGGPAFEVLISSIPSVQRMDEALQNAAGTTENVAAIMDDNLNGSLLRVRSAYEALVIEFGDLGPTNLLTQAMNLLAAAIRNVSDSIDRSSAANIISPADIEFIENLTGNVNRLDITFRQFLRTVDTADLDEGIIETQLAAARRALEVFPETLLPQEQGFRTRQLAQETIERLTGLTPENIGATFANIRQEIQAETDRLERQIAENQARGIDEADIRAQPLFAGENAPANIRRRIEELRGLIPEYEDLARRYLNVPIEVTAERRERPPTRPAVPDTLQPLDLQAIQERVTARTEGIRERFALFDFDVLPEDSLDRQREAQELALEHARALESVQQRLVSVGLEERNVAREAELWAETIRESLDLTTESGRQAAADLQRIQDIYRQLQSDDPLAGLHIGLETVQNQVPRFAESVRDATVSAFRTMEDTLVDFVRRGEFEFDRLVTSILADLARIAIQQQITGPLAAALGGIFGGAFGGGLGSVASGGTAVTGVLPSGLTLGAAGGGLIRGPGTGTSDSIRARLSDGEYVVNAGATRRFLPLLERLNSYQGGGQVRSSGTRVVVNDFRSGGEAIEVEQRQGGDGAEEILITVKDSVRAGILNGEFDGAMGMRYGQGVNLR